MSTITSITAGSTSIAVTWTDPADEYRINNGAATALPDGNSPDTITGLLANTEYNSPGLELRYLGGSWSTPAMFGTLNPATGADSISVESAPPIGGLGDRFTKLTLLGYSGSINDMLLAYYRNNGATSTNINEAEMQFLAAQGTLATPLNNRRRQFYVSLGYTGSLNDMEYAYWLNL